jgi:hypothetical protein
MSGSNGKGTQGRGSMSSKDNRDSAYTEFEFVSDDDDVSLPCSYFICTLVYVFLFIAT